MPNLHVVSNQAVTIAILTTTEQIIATMTRSTNGTVMGGPDFWPRWAVHGRAHKAYTWAVQSMLALPVQPVRQLSESIVVSL